MEEIIRDHIPSDIEFRSQNFQKITFTLSLVALERTIRVQASM